MTTIGYWNINVNNLRIFQNFLTIDCRILTIDFKRVIPKYTMFYSLNTYLCT